MQYAPLPWHSWMIALGLSVTAGLQHRKFTSRSGLRSWAWCPILMRDRLCLLTEMVPEPE